MHGHGSFEVEEVVVGLLEPIAFLDFLVLIRV
jgi:hypothetical protein